MGHCEFFLYSLVMVASLGNLMLLLLKLKVDIHGVYWTLPSAHDSKRHRAGKCARTTCIFMPWWAASAEERWRTWQELPCHDRHHVARSDQCGNLLLLHSKQRLPISLSLVLIVTSQMVMLQLLRLAAGKRRRAKKAWS